MPKSVNGLWEEIVSFENLFAAYKEARRGKRYRNEVLQFGYNLEENLINIQNHLIWKSWTPGKHRTFYVHDPKKRLISAPPFEDRVVHHAIVRVIEPLFEKKFIYDSYACRKDKGIHAATLRLQSFLRIAKRNWPKVYVLKADISSYFPSVNHQILLDILKRTIRDENVLWLCEKVISDFGYDEQGIPVGALTSQLFANVYLDQLDHYLKDGFGVKFYVRYMDDFVILGSAKKCLWGLLDKIKDFLLRLKLRLNPKTNVFPVHRGVDFAGYRTWATHILPRKRNVKKFRKKMKWIQKAYASGKIDLDYIRPRVMSFLGYMKHCNSLATTKMLLNEIVFYR
ncbi:alpha/beta hydrolase [Deferribacter autotrophicus]|uniref:Alpha/beta hydrolase n=1 Tax=Deferribacter autotrophicus TaxID=500465 RepID=A0A5A8F2W2_9BACT|nr:reverse transcriptase/maturase family protein [Deferribacter autotrophicus]KAA0257235.1 alpha/beta hydrolase [Deferribacter autotrophicus]